MWALLNVKINTWSLHFSYPWTLSCIPGPCLVSLDIVWYPWTLYGIPGSCLVSLDPVWYPWTLSGIPGPCMVSLDPVWYTWTCMVCLDLYGIPKPCLVCPTMVIEEELNWSMVLHEMKIKAWNLLDIFKTLGNFLFTFGYSCFDFYLTIV